MMNILRNISIRNKLTFIILSVVLLSIIIGFTLNSIREYTSLKEHLAADSIMTARLIGEYCISPLDFGYTDEVTANLSKLAAIPTVFNGYVYDADGNLFAAYNRIGEASAPPIPDDDMFAMFEGDWLHVFWTIEFNDEKKGTVYLRVSAGELSASLNNQLFALMLVGIGVMILAYFLAVGMQRVVSRPILKLAATTERISKEADYSIRTRRTGSDEIGILYDSFNNMLDQIEARTSDLNKEIGERRKAEEALRASEEKYHGMIRNLIEGVYSVTPEGTLLDYNDEFIRILGLDAGKDHTGISLPDFWQNVADRHSYFEEFLKHGVIRHYVINAHRVNGEEIVVQVNARMIRDERGEPLRIEGTFLEITDLKRAEEEKARIEEQYHQAQKVESIGRLAGGVAHDLNNLLSPILGYGELLLEDLDSNDNRRESVDEILSAALRARDLVRQLLAFSRKQMLEYRPVDMNDAVTGFDKLLRRTIREDIEIKIVTSPGIPMVMADIGQVEQVIMNLAVNAADAMPGGGRLTIETSPINLDDGYAAAHAGVQSGRYVMLAVSDTGFGMDEETRDHLFEPFFSTKGEHGTGLGLATVYGIVKQHGGNIWVYSEADKGTTFKIYLPASQESQVDEMPAPSSISADLRGSETILLVEDNEQVRHLARGILKRSGYNILVAENGVKAMSILASNDTPIQLLLTDVIMPEMNGKELFERVIKERPGTKVLYMSGYTDDVIARSGVLEKGIAFLQKPFTVLALTAKVREVLDRD